MTRLSLAVFLLLGLAPCLAAQAPRDPDLSRFDEISRRLQDANRTYEAALKKSRDQAAQNAGHVPNAEAAELLHQRERRDLLRGQLLSLAAITGRALPDHALAAANAGPAQAPPASNDVLEPARALVRQRFRAEAEAIARKVFLPVAQPRW